MSGAGFFFFDGGMTMNTKTKKPKEKNEMNLVKLAAEFGSEDKARAYLEALRWPTGVHCLRCKDEDVTPIKERHQYDCVKCGYQFSVTTGTIFHDTHLPLWKWLLAIYRMTESKKGVSACEVQRTVEVSYRTAWYLCHRIRAAMKDLNPAPLKGVVEVDETYIGGKARGRGRGYKGNKAIVAGAVEREGQIRLQLLSWADRETLHKFITDKTGPDTKAIYTDENRSYRGIGKRGRPHKTVNHSKYEWVHGQVHTNTVENVWSLLKRSVVGTYHKVSVKHLDAYLGELEHRFNNRENKYIFRDTVLKLLKAENLEYKKLVKKKAA